jgi:hypothetical protein
LPGSGTADAPQRLHIPAASWVNAMAFVPAPQIVMVEIRASLDGQNIENRLMVDALGPVSSLVLADITNIVSVWAQATYFDHLPAAVSLREIVGTDLTIQNGEQHTIVPAGAVNGALVGDPMPNEVTFSVQFKSAARGRSARGRAFVLGLLKSEVVGNFITEPRADSFVSDFGILGSALGTEGYSWVVVSYRTNKAPRVGGPVYFPISAVSYADRLVDSMKRRKPGVGT